MKQLFDNMVRKYHRHSMAAPLKERKYVNSSTLTSTVAYSYLLGGIFSKQRQQAYF
jgi:hypothetical protein